MGRFTSFCFGGATTTTLVALFHLIGPESNIDATLVAIAVIALVIGAISAAVESDINK